MEQRRTRSRNFTENEKNLLFELVINNYRDIVENKQTDSATVAVKKATWSEIAQKFNCQCQTGERTAKQLHALYHNLKKPARNNALSDRRNLSRGGTYSPKCSPLDDKIVSILGATSKSETLPNKIDLNDFNDSQPSCSKDPDPTETIENEVVEFKMSPGHVTEESNPIVSEAESRSYSPAPSVGRKRKRVVSVQAPKKTCVETLTKRFMQRKNFKDRHDEEIQAKRLEVLNLEKQIKLRQLTLIELQIEQERKLHELNYQARLEEIAYEKKIMEMKLKKIE